ncbi:MAG: hypothetical protein LBM08_07620 [Dysgonamonadaceae bacterium]|nr:hypothetical protein [Dysgonamonadaceae bacterium]
MTHKRVKDEKKTRKQELYLEEILRLHMERGYGEGRISRILLSDCLKGRTTVCTRHPAFQAASQGRLLIRGSITRGYENQALRAIE